MRKLIVALVVLLSAETAWGSIFGEENIALLQMVTNQLSELEKLTESIGIAEEQRKLLKAAYEGVHKVTEQIETIEIIVKRAEGLDPTAVRGLSDINQQISDLKDAEARLEDLIVVKMMLVDDAIDETAVQSETTYRMGQEMIGVGSRLAVESKSASPGRANQIAAAAASSQMMAQGVELQTLSHIAQLEAASLDLQKAQLERELRAERQRREFLEVQLRNSSLTPKRRRAAHD